MQNIEIAFWSHKHAGKFGERRTKMSALILPKLLVLASPIPIANFNNFFCKSVNADKFDGKQFYLQIPTTFVGAEQHRHNMTAVFRQEFFCEETVDMTLDKRSFANSIVSDNNDFCLGLGLF
jgi:hypothetical protein